MRSSTTQTGESSDIELNTATSLHFGISGFGATAASTTSIPAGMDCIIHPITVFTAPVTTPIVYSTIGG